MSKLASLLSTEAIALAQSKPTGACEAESGAMVAKGDAGLTGGVCVITYSDQSIRFTDTIRLDRTAILVFEGEAKVRLVVELLEKNLLWPGTERDLTEKLSRARSIKAGAVDAPFSGEGTHFGQAFGRVWFYVQA